MNTSITTAGILLLFILYGCARKQEQQQQLEAQVTADSIPKTKEKIQKHQCEHRNLSADLVFTTYLERHVTQSVGDSSIVKIVVTGKAEGEFIDSFTIYSNYFYSHYCPVVE